VQSCPAGFKTDTQPERVAGLVNLKENIPEVRLDNLLDMGILERQFVKNEIDFSPVQGHGTLCR